VPRLLEVNNLTAGIKKDGEIFQILKDVSFFIDEGEIVGLAGESGCGKSMTALSIPNLLPKPVKILGGEIIFNNKQLTSLGEKELCGIRGKEISVIFQDVRQSLNPLMRVGGQITEMLELSGSTDREANKTQALEMLVSLGFEEPEKIFDAFPHQLSGGMCQRVMTAIAAIRRPRLLLADEPSSALDMESQQRILSLLLEMNRKYKTAALIISHDLSIIRQFCSRFLVMYAGRIITGGSNG
jgi:ABC-type dipeptide/oligopeptide/nickel transport system ATPase component